jgi:hypothetical protein
VPGASVVILDAIESQTHPAHVVGWLLGHGGDAGVNRVLRKALREWRRCLLYTHRGVPRTTADYWADYLDISVDEVTNGTFPGARFRTVPCRPYLAGSPRLGHRYRAHHPALAAFSLGLRGDRARPPVPSIIPLS